MQGLTFSLSFFICFIPFIRKFSSVVFLCLLAFHQGFISPLISSLAAAYFAVYREQNREFFGLRDFYSLVKMLYGCSAASRRPPTWAEIERAIRRNFGGLDAEKPLEAFSTRLAHLQHNQEEGYSLGKAFILL